MKETVAMAILRGTTADDILANLPGDDIIIGGTGIDTATFLGQHIYYDIFENEQGFLFISGPEGTDQLKFIERLEFSDVIISINVGEQSSEFQVDTSLNSSITPKGVTLPSGFLISYFENIDETPFDLSATIYGVDQSISISVNNEGPPISFGGRFDEAIERYDLSSNINGDIIFSWVGLPGLESIQYRIFTPKTPNSDVHKLDINGIVQPASHISTSADEFGNFAILHVERLTVRVEGTNSFRESTEVFVNIINSDGVVVMDNLNILTISGNRTVDPVIEYIGNGDYYVVWQTSGDGLSNVNAAVLSSLSGDLGDVFTVNQFLTGQQSNPDIATIDDGKAIVTWTSFASHDGDKGGIFAQILDIQGNKIGQEILINTTTEGTQAFSVVEGLIGGGFVIAWASGPTNHVSYNTIRARLFDNNGQSIGSEFIVSGDEAFLLKTPAIVAHNDGGFIVTWGSPDSEGFGTSIFSKIYDETGTPIEQGYETTIFDVKDPKIGGAPGDDIFFGIEGSNEFCGGTGIDLIDYRGERGGSGVNLDFRLERAFDTFGNTDKLHSLENAFGSHYGDQLIGDIASNLMAGKSGNDYLFGHDNNDELHGNSGDDVLEGGLGSDLLNGGSGNDTASYAIAAGSVGVNLTKGVANDGEAGTDTLIGIENAVGSAFNDVLIGDSGANTLIGGDGFDRLDGRGGDDRMEGGAGDDIYTVREIGDVVVEGAAEGTRDRINALVDFTSPDNVEFLVGKFSSVGLNLTGNSGRDRIAGANKINSPDTILGLGGDDRLAGLVGDDVIDGGAGNDRIFGNSGDDILIGGFGDDVITGQFGNDVIVFQRGDGADRITDFNHRGDDTVDVTDFNTDFAALQRQMSMQGVNLFINLLNGDSILLESIGLSPITADDFIF